MPRNSNVSIYINWRKCTIPALNKGHYFSPEMYEGIIPAYSPTTYEGIIAACTRAIPARANISAQNYTQALFQPRWYVFSLT
jgi:hypothetical protein